MDKKITSNNIKNGGDKFDTEESDYTNLITRLNQIKTTIALLEETIFK